MRAKWLMALVALPVACGGAAGADPHFAALARVDTLAQGDSLHALARPAAYEGVLPCEDCSELKVVVVLMPDGSFRLRRQYLRRRDDGDGVFVSFGRWNVGQDSVRRLVLHEGESRTQFTVDGEMRLHPLDSAGNPLETRRANELHRVSAPAPLIGRLVVRGEFRYFADAATFVSCSGGSQFPIAGDSAFVRLQRAHHDHPLGDVGATTIDLVGRIEMRPPMENGPPVESIVVDSFAVVPEPVTCDAARVRAAVAVGDWQLSALDRAPLGDVAAALRPTLRFVLSEPTMFGNAGCNRFNGRAVMRGLDLQPTGVAMTKRLCADTLANQREARYGAVISEGGWFRLDGRALVLSHQGREVARFERR